MGIRQGLNENKPAAIIVVILLIAGLAAFLWWRSHSSTDPGYTTREFFSDDDGTSWFVDDGTKIAPFDHGGHQAVLARVFKCPDGKMFVGFMEKYSDSAKKTIESERAQPVQHAGPRAAPASETSDVILLKKPHQGSWVGSETPAAKAIRDFTCPDGGKMFEPVAP